MDSRSRPTLCVLSEPRPTSSELARDDDDDDEEELPGIPPPSPAAAEEEAEEEEEPECERNAELEEGLLADCAN